MLVHSTLAVLAATEHEPRDNVKLAQDTQSQNQLSARQRTQYAVRFVLPLVQRVVQAVESIRNPDTRRFRNHVRRDSSRCALHRLHSGRCEWECRQWRREASLWSRHRLRTCGQVGDGVLSHVKDVPQASGCPVQYALPELWLGGGQHCGCDIAGRPAHANDDSDVMWKQQDQRKRTARLTAEDTSAQGSWHRWPRARTDRPLRMTENVHDHGGISHLRYRRNRRTLQDDKRQTIHSVFLTKLQHRAEQQRIKRCGPTRAVRYAQLGIRTRAVGLVIRGLREGMHARCVLKES